MHCIVFYSIYLQDTSGTGWWDKAESCPNEEGNPGNGKGNPGNREGNPGNGKGNPGNGKGNPGNREGNPGNHEGDPENGGPMTAVQGHVGTLGILISFGVKKLFNLDLGNAYVVMKE